MSIGPPEVIIIILVVLLLFGSTRLPKLARSIGEASREFKKGVEETEKDQKAQAGQKAQPAPAPGPDDKVTMTQAELDAMLAEREARARKDAPPSP